MEDEFVHASPLPPVPQVTFIKRYADRVAVGKLVKTGAAAGNATN
jgi:hypothetical protein